MERAQAHRAALHKETIPTTCGPFGGGTKYKPQVISRRIAVYAQPWRLHPTSPCRTAAHLEMGAWIFAVHAPAPRRAAYDQKPFHLKMMIWRSLHSGDEPPAPRQPAERWGEPGRERRERNENGGAELLCRLSLIDSPKRRLLFRDKVQQQSTPTRLLPVGDPGRRDSTRIFSSTSFAENSMRRCS